MKRLILATAAMVLPFSAGANDALVTHKALKPEVALKMAQAAMQSCQDSGYQVGVAVVDRSGQLQAFVRDRFAGAHTVDTATRKAWTAVSFRTNTTELDEATQPGSDAYGIRFVDKALPLGGGIMIESGGSLLGAVGVSGAPGPELDDVCAEAGIAAIEDALGF